LDLGSANEDKTEGVQYEFDMYFWTQNIKTRLNRVQYGFDKDGLESETENETELKRLVITMNYICRSNSVSANNSLFIFYKV
jgi:hypothetical protein